MSTPSAVSTMAAATPSMEKPMNASDEKSFRMSMEVAALRAAVVGLIRWLPAEARDNLLLGLGIAADGFSPNGGFGDPQLSVDQLRIAEEAMRDLVKAITDEASPGEPPQPP